MPYTNYLRSNPVTKTKKIKYSNKKKREKIIDVDFSFNAMDLNLKTKLALTSILFHITEKESITFLIIKK